MKKRDKHGLSLHPLYKLWAGMRYRCENPNNAAYHNYGKRGIKVCKRWNNFAAFLEDMGEMPFKGARLERIDNDGNYSPENCKWANATEQMLNTRRNRLYTLDGVTKPRKEWCDEYGIHVSTFRARMRNGWTLRDALTRPTLPIGRAIN